MSGIIGLYYPDRRPVDQQVFGRMVDVLAHRGPDGTGVWIGDGIALARQMLHTTPESVSERFPLAHRQGDVQLTADVRIDNREELINQLSLRANEQNDITDTEIVLAAYEKWGEHCPEKLVGAYAFALWDPNRQALFCARDHYGLKPFYFGYVPGKFFVFSSEAKSILQYPEIPKELNETAIAAHLGAQVELDATYTFYKHVFRLAPGHFMMVDKGGLRSKRYWFLDPGKELSLGSDNAYAEAFHEAFSTAVSCRLRHHKPVGAMLSGGLDSSSIVGVAAPACEAQGEKLHTFSAVFDQIKLSDERPFIDAVHQKYDQQTIKHFMSADSVSPIADYDQLLWHQDRAVDAGNLYISWALYKVAREQGVRVMLEGFDGDTTVSHGVGYLHEMALKGQWVDLYKEVKAQTQRANAPWQDAMWKWVRKYKVDPLLRQSVGGRAVLGVKASVTKKRWTPQPAGQKPLSWESLLNIAFKRRIQSQFTRKRPLPESEREDHFRLLTRPLMQHAIELLEASAAANQLEVRLPFCDRRLMELCLSMPSQQKRSLGWTRVVMRRAMEHVLPPEIQWRDGKGNLAPGFDHGLLVLAGSHLKQMICEDTGGIGRYVDLKALRNQYPEFKLDRMDHNTIHHWRALSLALWLQHTGL